MLNKNNTIFIISLPNELQRKIKNTLKNKGLTSIEIDDALNSRLSDLSDILNHCSKCGNYFLSGFDKFVDDCYNYCNKCHSEVYTEKEWQELYDKFADCCYYTTEE